ncbi:hypothetical protein MtrunA17_Chr3g0142291 [Medicago truncatula]|uniref:Uncharacterized protein n=1 Tax=Medicago truncatula TaxID=3880 RepID=A0A396J302_MEDTR|nr:hypothetical protein MtrunA17_Chr3g0142291 [Medicago truncatula]
MCLLSHKYFNLPMYVLQEALVDKQIIYSVQLKSSALYAKCSFLSAFLQFNRIPEYSANRLYYFIVNAQCNCWLNPLDARLLEV